MHLLGLYQELLRGRTEGIDQEDKSDQQISGKYAEYQSRNNLCFNSYYLVPVLPAPKGSMSGLCKSVSPSPCIMKSRRLISGVASKIFLIHARVLPDAFRVSCYTRRAFCAYTMLGCQLAFPRLQVTLADSTTAKQSRGR